MTCPCIRPLLDHLIDDGAQIRRVEVTILGAGAPFKPLFWPYRLHCVSARRFRTSPSKFGDTARINVAWPRASAVRSNRHGPKNDTEVVARCGETFPLKYAFDPRTAFQEPAHQLTSEWNSTRQAKTVSMMLSNKYEKNSARCVRLARQSGDAVLSYGLMKMAEAWLELGRNRHPKTLHEQRRQLSADNRSRRGNPRIGSSSRRVIRRSKAPSKTAANKQTG
jgi:hypothetical protein